MKREYVAVSIIFAILVLSIINTAYVENKTNILTDNVIKAETLYNGGDREEAAKLIEDSRDVWLGWDSYAHIMLRHSEVDLVTDAYFVLLSELQGENEVTEASFGKLREQLRSISVMEKITVGSIL